MVPDIPRSYLAKQCRTLARREGRITQRGQMMDCDEKLTDATSEDLQRSTQCSLAEEEKEEEEGRVEEKKRRERRGESDREREAGSWMGMKEKEREREDGTRIFPLAGF